MQGCELCSGPCHCAYSNGGSFFYKLSRKLNNISVYNNNSTGILLVAQGPGGGSCPWCGCRQGCGGQGLGCVDALGVCHSGGSQRQLRVQIRGTEAVCVPSRSRSRERRRRRSRSASRERRKSRSRSRDRHRRHRSRSRSHSRGHRRGSRDRSSKHKYVFPTGMPLERGLLGSQ